MTEKLSEEKYKKFEWIFPETKTYLDVFSSYKASKGLIKVSISISGDRIENLKISGGFIIYPENAVEEIEKGLRGETLDEETLREKIQELFAVKGIQTAGVTVEDLTRAIISAYRESLAK
jgi:hypothetical protein